MPAPPYGSLGVLTGKGDLLGVDASGNVERLAPGSDGQTLECSAAAPTGLKWVDPSGGGGGTSLINGFRLSPTAGESVPLSDVVAATNVHLVRHNSDRLALWDGSKVVEVASAGVTKAVTGRTTNLLCDVWGYKDGAVPAMEFLNWTDATNRATGWEWANGMMSQVGDSTRRLLGTMRPRSATTYDWVTAADIQSRQVAMDLSNVDNGVEIALRLNDVAGGNAYTTAIIRQWRASANAQMDLVSALGRESVYASAYFMSVNTVSPLVDRTILLSYDSTTAKDIMSTYNSSEGATSERVPLGAGISKRIESGRHYISLLQWSQASGTTTFQSSNHTASEEWEGGVIARWTC
jgi:hypothetical protein